MGGGGGGGGGVFVRPDQSAVATGLLLTLLNSGFLQTVKFEEEEEEEEDLSRPRQRQKRGGGRPQL